MGHFSSMFNSLARSFSNKKDNNNGKSNAKEAADEMAREAKKKAMILKSSGCVNADGSNNLASVFSRRGEKGVNQDCAIVWEVHYYLSMLNYLGFSVFGVYLGRFCGHFFCIFKHIDIQIILMLNYSW